MKPSYPPPPPPWDNWEAIFSSNCPVSNLYRIIEEFKIVQTWVDWGVIFSLNSPGCIDCEKENIAEKEAMEFFSEKR